ncbi:MAG: YCF48-related protein [Pseudomonadota bacterium]
MKQFIIIFGLILCFGESFALEAPEGGCINNLWVTPKGGVFATATHPSHEHAPSFNKPTGIPVFFSNNEGESFKQIQLTPSDNEDPLTSIDKFSGQDISFYFLELPNGEKKYITNRAWISKEGEELLWKDISPRGIITDIVPFIDNNNILSLFKYFENGEENPSLSGISITNDFGNDSKSIFEKKDVAFTKIIIDKKTGYFYASTDKEIYRSKDKGKKWKIFLDFNKTKNIKFSNKREYKFDGNAQIRDIIIDNNDKTSKVYVIFNINHILRSDNDGKSWKELIAAPERYSYSEFLSSLAISRKQPNLLYFADQIGLFRSEDYGDNWKELSNKEKFLSDIIRAFAIDLNDDQKIYVGNCHGVFSSKDGGVTWKNSNSGIKSLSVVTETHDPKNPNIIFIGTNDGVIYRTDDGGKSWSQGSIYSTNGIETIRYITINPHNTEIIYAADINNIYGSSNSGKYHYRCGNLGITTSYELKIETPNENDVIVTVYDPPNYISKETKILGSYISNDRCHSFKKRD